MMLIAAYCWVAWKTFAIVDRYKPRLAFALLVVFIAAPLVDAIGGRVVLHSRCEKESGVVVEQRIQNVEGIRVDSGVYETSPIDWGYNFVESAGDRGLDRNLAGLVTRATRTADPKKASLEKNVPPQASYALLDTETSSKYFFHQHLAVVQVDTRREIAHFNWYRFRGGWAERLVGQFSDAGGAASVQDCSDEPIASYRRAKEMVSAALEPAPFSYSEQ